MNTTNQAPCTVAAGGSGAAPAIKLTKREVEILIESATGDKARIIAERMFLSKRTIDFHRANLFKKLGVNSILAAIHAAVAKGLVDSRRVLL